MRTRLFHTIVAVSAAFAAPASWGCGDAGTPSARKGEPPSDGASRSDETPLTDAGLAEAGGSAADGRSGDGSAAYMDLDAAIDVDAGWPPTK